MLTVFPALSHPRRIKPKKPAAISPPPPPPPPPVALTLVAATYSEATQSLQLAFDRAINIDAFDPSAVYVLSPADEESQYHLAAQSATLIDPQTMQVAVILAYTVSGVGTILEATSGTGIVAVDDGGTWAGATDLALPFP